MQEKKFQNKKRQQQHQGRLMEEIYVQNICTKLLDNSTNGIRHSSKKNINQIENNNFKRFAQRTTEKYTYQSDDQQLWRENPPTGRSLSRQQRQVYLWKRHVQLCPALKIKAPKDERIKEASKQIQCPTWAAEVATVYKDRNIYPKVLLQIMVACKLLLLAVYITLEVVVEQRMQTKLLLPPDTHTHIHPLHKTMESNQSGSL